MNVASPALASMTTAVVLVLSACKGDPANTTSEESEPGRQEVTVSVSDTEARYHVASRGVEATLAVRIRNAGPEAIFFHPCGTSLERRIDGEWRRVWFMVCPTADSWPETAVAPGETASADVTIHAVPGETIATDWKHPIDGEYRVLVALNNERTELSQAARVSQPFALRADTVR
jgi:hypothetical protein